MGLFQRKPDPIAQRERELNARIASLEEQIRELHDRIEQEQAQPKLRSTAMPHAPAVPAVSAPTQSAEPAFEQISHQRVRTQGESSSASDHYDDLGVRKYDLGAVLRRWLDHLRGTPAPNPRLVNYLAAGGIHGLRPLRYEKRVARNRCIGLLALIIAVLWGAYWFYTRGR